MLHSKGNPPKKRNSFDKKKLPKVLAWFVNSIFRRASTQSWLIATNLLSLAVISISIALFVQLYSSPRLTLLESQEAERQIGILSKLLQSSNGLEEAKVQLTTISALSGTSFGLFFPDGTSITTPDFRAEGKITAKKNIPLNQLKGHTQGTLIANYGHSSFLNEMNRNRMYILLFSIITAICSIWLASWLASKKITQPLQKITQTAKHIINGQLDEEIKIESQAAEIQDLAESLTLMARRFRLDIRELKRLTSFQNEFLGNVSHEVRNPIFAIGGYIEALGADNLTPKMRQIYVGKGLNNVQRLNGLFSDLLEIARLEYREEAIKPESFDLKTLLDEVADELDYLAQEKSLDLVVDNEPQKIYADRSRIRQVLSNLIQNGLKYTDIAHGVVRVRYRKNGNKVRIEVLDNGRGIPEEHIDHIFERFYRVDAARSRAMGGTGLGLSIVKQILNAHGEQIHAESTEGRGSRFWFELPISAPASSANSI